MNEQQEDPTKRFMDFFKICLPAAFDASLDEEIKKDKKGEFKAIARNFLELLYGIQSKSSYIRAHSTIAKVIGSYFEESGWNCGYEIPFGDLDSKYRFDILAQKGAKTAIVEVKPTLSVRDLGQVIAYVHDVEKKFRNVRVFIGTDILNLYTVLGTGEIRDIILENARLHKLGIIFTDSTYSVVLPAEFLLAMTARKLKPHFLKNAEQYNTPNVKTKKKSIKTEIKEAYIKKAKLALKRGDVKLATNYYKKAKRII